MLQKIILVRHWKEGIDLLNLISSELNLILNVYRWGNFMSNLFLSVLYSCQNFT